MSAPQTPTHVSILQKILQWFTVLASIGEELNQSHVVQFDTFLSNLTPTAHGGTSVPMFTAKEQKTTATLPAHLDRLKNAVTLNSSRIPAKLANGPGGTGDLRSIPPNLYERFCTQDQAETIAKQIAQFADAVTIVDATNLGQNQQIVLDDPNQDIRVRVLYGIITVPNNVGRNTVYAFAEFAGGLFQRMTTPTGGDRPVDSHNGYGGPNLIFRDIGTVDEAQWNSPNGSLLPKGDDYHLAELFWSETTMTEMWPTVVMKQITT